MDDSLQASSPLAWTIANRFVTENQKPLEYEKHRFLIQPMNDMHPDQAYCKSAQVGMSVAKIIKSAHVTAYKGLNVGYILPTKNVVKDFVTPKVDPLISSNPAIRNLVSRDSVSLKQIGDRFIYFKGAFSERDAISVSLDLLVLDELDRMQNMSVVNTFDSRLQASDYGWRWRLSNPSVPNFGVHEWFLDSTQFHWFVKCHHCNHDWFMNWEASPVKNHYIDRTTERPFYACGKCGKEISNQDRIDGRWVAAFPNKTHRHGYWMSQLMAPWVTAERIVQQYKESDAAFFHNFVLGLPFQAADLLIDRKSILDATEDRQAVRRNVVMGTDVGKPHWYWLASPDGYFEYGQTTSWDELERIFLLNQCDAWVIDSMPEFTMVQEMIRKYPGKVFGAVFPGSGNKEVATVRWMEGDKRGLVYIDRTRAIDRIVTELNAKDMMFLKHPKDMEDFIYHASNLYRSVETDDKGVIKVHWKTKEGKPDHLVFALLYCRVALERAFSGIEAGVVETQPLQNTPTAPTIQDGSISLGFDIEGSIDRAKN